ncbi:DUF4822 domain-containing protein [Glutamicibacter endophyticus]|uniref:DUF4822 domain-containing protein n=1 Tax=Glutamicibacter endophyticus TaxID=1522174 RepID=UPI003AF18C15
MNFRSKPVKTATALGSALLAAGLLVSCASGVSEQPTTSAEASATQSPSQLLAATAWETTGAVDQDGQEVDLSDERAANFVGYAYFNQDGSFQMYTLDDEPKMQGEWSISEDGATRHIVAKDEDGKVLFERVSHITTLTGEEFTYRVPAEDDPEQFVDIVHTPTDHLEPTK